MPTSDPTKGYQQEDGFGVSNLQIAAYMFAGLAMMLNIRLSYSAAPYALLRFKLPENLFSVFVRTTSSALELWCIPSMLIGNIMEQAYNNTQDKESSHATGIKNYADDIKSKAENLKINADEQSTSELATTQNTDLTTGNNPQAKLGTKAGTLAQKADLLHTAASQLETAATSGPLDPLHETAGLLKNAAKNDAAKGSGEGLYQAATELAKKRIGDAAKSQADGVIEKFETVETQYEELMGKAEANKLTNHPNVIAVVKTYHEVKTTYYQMLIIYRIQKKANEFHSAAENLQQTAQAQAEKPQLKALNDNASNEMQDLVTKANDLKNINVSTGDFLIVTKYLEVETAYKALAKKSEFTAAEKESEVQNVKTTFGPLQKSYVNALKLRVQELSNLAQTLSTKANTLSTSVGSLTTQANALRDAASQAGTGLKQKADDLVAAINGTTGGTNAQATAVIQKFEAVTDKYKELAKQQTYSTVVEKIEKGQDPSPGDETKVKAVYDAYKALKTLYDKILKFAKLAKIAQDLYNAANSKNVTNIITNYQNVIDSYNELDRERKSHLQSDFDNLQIEYSNAIYVYKKYFLTWTSIATNWLNFLTFVILLIVFVTGGDNGHVTGYYWIMAISGFVFGINMVLVYAVDYRYLPFYMAGENSFPMVTSLILYFATSIFGNRRKYNSDYLVVLIDVSIAIIIAFVASVLWTMAFYKYRAPMYGDLTPKWPELVSPVAMVIVGMGLVYSIYPGIAPGMIVPFYLIDKIEMVLLIATAFPPVIIAILRKYAPDWSPSTNFVFHGTPDNPNTGMGGWKQYASEHNWGGGTECAKDNKDVYAWIWHFFDILIPLQISLAVIFIYSIHYRDSSISRSIVNQPKMSTFLTIVFYMCHEILLALGFPGMVGNGGAGGAVLLPVQYVGALLMVFLAFYSIGYITEYKKHDPSQWPTDGMTWWDSVCYCLKMASKITNKNFKQLFTTDLLCDLIYCPTHGYIME